jgi:hypothetical protein
VLRLTSSGLTLFLITILIWFSISAGSVIISNQTTDCSDIVILFARGSSSNPEGLSLDKPFSEAFELGVDDPNNPGKIIGAEEVPGSFFRWMEKRITADYPNINYKAISIHNSGKGWSPNGYPAVGIFDFNPFQQNFHNMIGAEFSWWPAGLYRESVGSGAIELTAQVNDEVTHCPNQRIVIGGYSQGAHVVHEALNLIPENQRNIIDNVVLFGDPKFVGSEYNKLNPFQKPRAYPWHRGTAGLREEGLADALVPYVPTDMEYKTISWCHEDDFVCTGMSGVSWSASNNILGPGNGSISDLNGALGDGHRRYPVFGVPEATEEVVANLHSHLLTLEKQRGGFDPEKEPIASPYSSGMVNNRAVDLMFAFNFTSGNEDALFQYFQRLRDMLGVYKGSFPRLAVGSVMYTDMTGDSVNSPVSGYTRQPLQLNPSNTSTYSTNLYMYGPMGGGGDYPENHGMAIERAGMFADWRSDATKHLVLFAERPAHEAYSFNICDSAVVSALPHSGEQPCIPGSIFNTDSHPEWCSDISSVLRDETCEYNGPATSTHIVSRTLADAVILARAKGFAVDIIQPHTARTGVDEYPPTKVEEQLSQLAESTGGLYLKYEAFGEAEMRDALWRILNHRVQAQYAREYVPSSLLNFTSPTPMGGVDSVAILPTGTTSLITTSPVSGARSYEWDITGDEGVDLTSYGPSIEIQPEATKNVISARAVTPVNVPASARTAYIVTDQYIPYTPAYETRLIDGLEGLITEQSGAHIRISWDTRAISSTSLVLVKDAVSGALLHSVGASRGSANLEPDMLSGKLNIQLVNEDGESSPQPIDMSVPGWLGDDVGQNIDKVVTQKEQNTIQRTTTTVRDTPSFNGQSSPSLSGDTQATFVQGDVVETNPQDNVGGVEDVKRLFPGEDVGGTPVVEEELVNWRVILLVGVGVLVLCGGAAVLIYRQNNSENNE